MPAEQAERPRARSGTGSEVGLRGLRLRAHEPNHDHPFDGKLLRVAPLLHPHVREEAPGVRLQW